MPTNAQAFTPAETAVIAGVSLRDVHRVIDERLIPESLYETNQARTFKPAACVFISFYFQSAAQLTAEERTRTIALANEAKTADDRIQNGFLTIDLKPFRTAVDDRAQHLKAAEEMVVSDPEILGGLPVIKGTRVPVHTIAAWIADGESTETILGSYPSVKHEQLELAALYAEAHPFKGKPRLVLPEGAKLISSTRGTLPRTA